MTLAEFYPADVPSLPTDAPAAATPSPRQPRRRWFQFRLRTLMIFMVVVSVLLGAFASRLQRARRQARIVADLRALRVSVGYEYDDPPAREWRSQLAEEWLTRDFFEDVIAVNACECDRVGFIVAPTPIPLNDARKFWNSVYQFPALRTLIIHDNQVTPSDIRGFSGDGKLETLIVRTSVVTDEHLREISRLKRLKVLMVGGDSIRGQKPAIISFRGIDFLQLLPQLTHLDLSGTTLDDRAAESLLRIERVETLMLIDTQISDDGLRRLVRLKRLTEINVFGTRVTSAGAKALQLAMPNCEVKCFNPKE